MVSISCPVRHILKRDCRRIFQSNANAAIATSRLTTRRCFHLSSRWFAEEGQKGHSNPDITKTAAWKEFKDTYNAPTPTFEFDKQIPLASIGTTVTAAGFMVKVVNMGEKLVFAQIQGGSGTNQVQIICTDPSLREKLSNIRLDSPVNVTGEIALKHAPKKVKAAASIAAEGYAFLDRIEIRVSDVHCLNSFPADLHHGPDHIFPPQSRHLQIRYDTALRKRLLFRSDVAAFIRQEMEEFQEIETPILFKSTPEGAKEFLVPTRKLGFAYALPQSPQQYKQILMASGISRYLQFAKCFRDEDLRADRQPEFTQVDLEMAFTDGEGVMNRVEKLVKALYERFDISISSGGEPFFRVTYDEAMSKHGSDKPDLRIPGLIHRIDHIVSSELKGMLTSIDNPIIEIFKMPLGCSPKEAQLFIGDFLDSPDAEVFRNNVDGAPGIAVFDPSRPVEGLQIFGFEGAEKLKELYGNLVRRPYENNEYDSEFTNGDVLLIQARPNLPHSGGSTMLGKLRLALQKAAIERELIEPPNEFRFIWVTDFPMFTLEDGIDPGQGGSAGFSATHHPFTAPKTAADVDLLLTDPLKAKADHYDLVVNGVELGGGSRRIHNADMQQFVMRDILKMTEERLADFTHLFNALRAGCPPHAGLAIGFDRLIAVMTGKESVKDVIAFPKSSKGEDMMVKSPSRMTNTELKRYNLALLKSGSGEDK